MTLVGGSGNPYVEDDRPEESNEQRAARRARTTLRRYCTHNGLRHMFTLTYREAPEGMPNVNEDMRKFRYRLQRTGWFSERTWPYAWVTEVGTKGGRMHNHMAVAWWEEVGAVEVCERCALPQLRKVRRDIPPAGSRCVGCVWGLGFVGAPTEGNGDPRLVARYVSKYVAKSFGDGRLSVQRYRVAQGFMPEPVTVYCRTADEAIGLFAQANDGLAPEVFAHHEREGYDGPPAWSLEVPVESLHAA